MLFPVFAGRYAFNQLKGFGKVRQIRIPHRLRNCVKLCFRIAELFFGDIYAVAHEVAGKGLVHLRGKQSAKIRGRNIKHCGNVSQRRVRVIFPDILERLLNQAGFRRFLCRMDKKPVENPNHSFIQGGYAAACQNILFEGKHKVGFPVGCGAGEGIAFPAKSV